MVSATMEYYTLGSDLEIQKLEHFTAGIFKFLYHFTPNKFIL